MVRKTAGMIISISIQMIVCALVIIVLYHTGVKGYEFGQAVFSREAVASEKNGKDMIVIVEKDASEADVAKLLESKGLVKDDKVFWLQAKLYKAELYPGTYTLNTSMTSEEMLQILMTKPDSGEEK